MVGRETIEELLWPVPSSSFSYHGGAVWRCSSSAFLPPLTACAGWAYRDLSGILLGVGFPDIPPAPFLMLLSVSRPADRGAEIAI